MAKNKQVDDHDAPLFQSTTPPLVHEKLEPKATPRSVSSPPTPPDFDRLLRNPLVTSPLPADWNVPEEAAHLSQRWTHSEELRQYAIDGFVHAGGSGMVFKVRKSDSPVSWAMKVVRNKLYKQSPSTSGEIATTLSPVSESELKALQKVSHPNVVRLCDVLSDAKGVFAICTSYVENPKPIDDYLRERLIKDSTDQDIDPLSLQRLDNACHFLLLKLQDIANALEHMHHKRMFHFDVKPANILMDSDQDLPTATLTDMGSCIDAGAGIVKQPKPLRVHFTWMYAHSDLTNLVHDPGGLTGGGLKASATPPEDLGLARYDLFALGKTIQDLLAIVEGEFRERCHSSYGFRFLHVVACLLLDGHNAPNKGDQRREAIVKHHGKRFVNDVALDYPPELFEAHKITTMKELSERLQRFSPKYSWNDVTPELNSWQPEIINCVAHSPAPWTRRVSAIFEHPCFRRLKVVHPAEAYIP